MADEPIIPAPADADADTTVTQQPVDSAPPEWEAEKKTLIDQRQAEKQARRELQAELAEKDRLLAAQSIPEADRDAFAAWKTQQAEAQRKKALADGDAEKIEKAAREPLARELEAEKQRRLARETQLSATLRDDALRKAAATHGAYNPEQVVRLLRDRVQMTERDGQFVPEFLDDAGTPLFDANGRVSSADAFVGMFRGDPGNSNLFKADTVPGSGAKPPGGPIQTDGAIPKTLEEFQALSPEERAIVAPKIPPAVRKGWLGVTHETGGASLLT